MGNINSQKKTFLKIEFINYNSSDLCDFTYSEIGEDRYEIRKIDIWKNGKIEFAFDDIEYGNTFLGIEPMPSLEVLNYEDKWGKTIAQEISFKEFEQVWEEKVVPLLKL